MAEISDQELADIHAFAVQLGKDAGDMLMRALQQRMAGDRGDERAAEVQYVLKENAVDIVTKTDNGSHSYPCWTLVSRDADSLSRGGSLYS